MEQPKVIGGIGEKKSNKGTQYFLQNRIYEADAALTICAINPYYKIDWGGNYMKNELRIRKLTPSECLKLMGFSKSQYQDINDFSDGSLYHVAGDSICVPVLVALFGELTDIDYRQVINDYVEKEIVYENRAK